MSSRTSQALWLALGLPALALGSCSDENKKPTPTVTLITGGAGDGEGGAGPVFVPPGGEGPILPGEPCNGWPQLCARSYDEVTYPVTHAAMANSATFWDHPAQDQGLRTQLDDSIRGLMLEVHDKAGVPTLCFNDCADGAVPLLSELEHVAGFLDDNPREVVTLFVDNRVPGGAVAQVVDAARLTPYLYQGDASWPTLQEMIDGQQRLVVFLSDASGAGKGFLSLGDNVRATSNLAATARDLACDTPTGSADAPLILDLQTLAETAEIVVDESGGAGGAGAATSLTVGWPSAKLAATVNRDPFFSERLGFCAQIWGRQPTYVAVDFYDASDVIAVAQRASGLIP